jgi:hypothetical protein
LFLGVDSRGIHHRDHTFEITLKKIPSIPRTLPFIPTKEELTLKLEEFQMQRIPPDKPVEGTANQYLDSRPLLSAPVQSLHLYCCCDEIVSSEDLKNAPIPFPFEIRPNQVVCSRS